MKTIKLISLDIKNFQGIKNLHIDFDGCDAKIRGDNGTGKTTVKSAFNWLLFGKNAEGKTDFGIKPTDADGNVIHRLETSVEAVFEVDGIRKQFMKTLNESWVRKRGAATETFSGNENTFFVNTVPKKKTEYMVEINTLINEELFKMITDPLYFNQIAWKDRREMILDICGEISDGEVFGQDAELLPLQSQMNGITVDEYKSILARDMKAINKELSVIPSQINEAELAKPTSTETVDVSRKQALEKEISDLRTAKSEITNGAEIVKLKSDRSLIERDIASISSNVDPYMFNSYKNMQAVKTQFDDVSRKISTISAEIARNEETLKTTNEAMAQALADWDKVFAEQFKGSTCPTCGQEFPPETLEEKKRAFNTDRANKLDIIQQSITTCKDKQTELLSKIKEFSEQKQKIEQSLAEKDNRIKELEIEYQKEVDALNAEREKVKAGYIKQREEIDAKIANYDETSREQIAEIDAKIEALNNELHEINVIEAGVELEKRQTARIQELMDRQTALSKEYMDKERWLALAERFIITKVRMLNEKINEHFKYANFKLFTQNINGGIEETCEVTYNGIPFKDLNSAGRINIGLDIINTLCRKNETTAPIFIDNAESVTQFIETDSQKVLLVVDENHKVLYVEKEN